MNAPLTLWACATAGHFALTGVWIHRSGFSRSRDEFWFSWMLVSIGSLVAAIHICALVSGLTLTSGVVVLACVHVAAAILDRGRRPAPRRERSPWTVSAIETFAIVTLCAIVVSWTLNASRTLDVVGTDAAHYHVPAAVNLALGSGLFDLPATPHLYPLVSSAIVAWFILPLRDALLIDIGMLMPFLLLASAAAYLFHVVTGASGLAWTTWLILALFSTPLFRAASMVSADLLFAASYVALLTQLLALLNGAPRAFGLPLAGLATGLLLGSKTAGLPAAILLWLCALAVWPLLRKTALRSSRLSLAGSLAIATSLCVAAGGIWLVRNWVLWGSPMAPTGLTIANVEIFKGIPHETSDYLSVLGDQRKDPGYHLWARAAHFIKMWLGSWYLPGLLPILLLAGDAVLGCIRRPGTDGKVRLALFALVLGSGIPLAWLLAGAPWTSLEWTGGFSLRYLLPVAALLPLLALIGCFPSTWPWVRHRTWSFAGAALLAAVAITLVVRSQGVADVHPPRIEWGPLVLASAVCGVLAVVRLRAPALVAVILFALTGAWAAVVDTHDAIARRQAQEQTPAAQGSDVAIYRKLLQAEQERGLACEFRRIFVLVRFDAPLALQSVVYRNQVFYAARDLAVFARADPMTRCDYIVTSRPVMATDRGQRMIATLNRFGDTWELGEAAPFVLLGRR